MHSEVEDSVICAGKGFWGYYLVGGDPTSFMFWDTQADKDSGVYTPVM